MNAPIMYIGGSKGGVGKSKMSFALINYLTEQKSKILLIETDNANPDVFKAHEAHKSSEFMCEMLDLDNAEGWIELINLADQYPDHIIVINSAARSGTGIKKYGATLRDILAELDRELITFWMINRQRDSIELLYNFMDVYPDARIHVCRNLYFGNSEKFELYQSSKLRENIEKNYKSLDFPDLADRVADKLYSDRSSIKTALEKLPIGDRAELKRWRQKYMEMLTEVLATTLPNSSAKEQKDS